MTAADAADTARRRHGDADGVRSDSGDADRSRRTRGKRALVTPCRQTRAPRTLLLISMIYSVHTVTYSHVHQHKQRVQWRNYNLTVGI